MKRISPIVVTHISRRFLWTAHCKRCASWILTDATYSQYRRWTRIHAAAHHRRDKA